MKKGKMLKSASKYIVLLLIFSGIFFLSACKRSVSPEYTDVDAIQDYIYNHPSLFQADVFDTMRVPLFYREITKRDNVIGIDFREPVNDTFFSKYALVNWDDTIAGVFHTFISGKEYTKELKAFSRVQARFELWGGPGDIYRGWLFISISNSQISSSNSTVGFSQVRVNFSGSDSSINLGGLYDTLKVLRFNKSTEVIFTLQASDSNDFYFLHIYEGGTWRKIPFQKAGSGDFKAKWTTSSSNQDLDIYKHAYIDCLDSATVDDSLFRYNSRAWGILYKIKP